MDRDEKLDSLLDRWRQGQEEGRPVTAEELCAESPELLPRLRSMIGVVAHIEGLLVDPGLEQTPVAPSSTVKHGKPVRLPKPVAPPGYEILEEVGRGGMGVVYKAKQVGLDRLVALKMLLAGDLARPDDQRRFRTEAAAVAALQHPNIVQIYEIGEYDGRAFLSLEYVEGPTLADRLWEQPLRAAEAAALTRTLALAIQAAHDRGIVHRDLKPANILMQEDGTTKHTKDTKQEEDNSSPFRVFRVFRVSTLLPKITDFGLAKRLDDPSQTGPDAILGTPYYMPPELASGGSREARPTVDVYSLGCILYECLTGQVPFRAATLAELFDLIRRADPVPPRRLNDRIPRDLETICLKCLQKDPERRYATARALADDLGRYLDGRPIQARPVGPAERAVRWANRNRALAIGSGIATLVLLGLIGVGFWVSAKFGAERAAREQEGERARAAEQLAEARRIFELLTTARSRIAHGRPGWTWDATDDLRAAAALPVAADHAVALRTEALRCAGAVDARLTRTIVETPRATCIAWHPTRRLVAVGNRAGGALYPANVTLIDLDGQEKPRRLLLGYKLVPRKGLAFGPETVHAVAFSPDGRWLAAGTRAGDLHVWDLKSEAVKPLSHPAHAAAISQVLFGPDSRTLYSVSAKGVQRATVEKLAAQATLPLDDRTSRLALHPRDGWLAVADGPRTRRLDPTTLKPRAADLTTAARNLALGPDGRTMVLGEGRAVWVWDAEGDRRLHTLRADGGELAHSRAVSDLAVSPDGTLLLTASEDAKRVRLWDLISGQVAATLPVESGFLKLAFAPDGRSFAVTGEDRVLVYEVGGRREQTIVARRATAVQGFAFGAEGRVASVSEGATSDHGELTVGPDTVVPFAPLALHRTYPLALAGDGLAALNVPMKKLLMAEVPGGRTRWQVPLADDGRGLCLAPDGRLWTAAGNEVAAWDAGGKQVGGWKNVLGIELRGVEALLAVAAGRKWAVVAGQDGDVRILSAGGVMLKAQRNLIRGPLSCVALSPDEALAVAGSQAGRAWLVRVPAADVVTELPAMAEAVQAVAWSRHDLVACGCQDGTVTLLRRAGERLEVWCELRHERPLRGLAFDADGGWLGVLLQDECGVRVWHLDAVRTRLAEMGLGESPAALLP